MILEYLCKVAARIFFNADTTYGFFLTLLLEMPVLLWQATSRKKKTNQTKKSQSEADTQHGNIQPEQLNLSNVLRNLEGPWYYPTTI